MIQKFRSRKDNRELKVLANFGELEQVIPESERTFSGATSTRRITQISGLHDHYSNSPNLSAAETIWPGVGFL
jgi:hypothetical protein